MQLINTRKLNKEKDIMRLIQNINELNKSGNINGIWKLIKTIRKNNTFDGIKELYGNNNNFIISTEEVKQIITNYIKTEFHIDDSKHDIFEEIKQIGENISINNDTGEILNKEIPHAS